MKGLLYSCCMLFFSLNAEPAIAQKRKIAYLSDKKALLEYFHYSGKVHPPIISGHRGTVENGYPENSMAAFAYVLKHTDAFFEVDPRLTKDSVIVLMHDATLDRTTTGKGKLSDYTYDELQQFFLKDNKGRITSHKIPTLLDALQWSKGKTVLNLDHKGVPLNMIAEVIRQSNNPVVMLTIHTPEQARFYLERDSRSMFSVHLLNDAAFTLYENAKIPWKNMIAYIGPRLTAENRRLMARLHEKGVMCMVSAAPGFDKLPTTAERTAGYRDLFKAGVDILESDLPVEVATALRTP